ncbi:MAG: hypothetical protein ACTFAL_11930 [Candidatus Electronema sp. V4]|uniref:hypothetical protein n=1 Tax=Candidatus Electronema sp. V4 TaxID=3454756 RepID=UPI0040558085
MSTNVNFSEVLITPAATMIREICASVAEAQRVLDAAAMDSQAALAETNPDLAKAGYQVTWYQIPEVDVEIKVAMHFERKDAQSPQKVYIAPFNAKYRTGLQFTSDGSSTVKIRIVPVPPVVASTK